MVITGSICLMAAGVYINKYIDTDMDLTITSTELNYSTQIFATDSEGNNQILYTNKGNQLFLSMYNSAFTVYKQIISNRNIPKHFSTSTNNYIITNGWVTLSLLFPRST